MAGILVALRVGAFLVCWSVVLAGMFAPPSTLASLSGLNDKGLHLVALFAMAVTAWGAFPRLDSRLLWGGLLCLAVALEFVQSWLQPARSFSLYDIAANLGGVALAVLVCLGLVFFRRCTAD